MLEVARFTMGKLLKSLINNRRKTESQGKTYNASPNIPRTAKIRRPKAKGCPLWFHWVPLGSMGFHKLHLLTVVLGCPIMALGSIWPDKTKEVPLMDQLTNDQPTNELPTETLRDLSHLLNALATAADAIDDYFTAHPLPDSHKDLDLYIGILTGDTFDRIDGLDRYLTYKNYSARPIADYA